VTGRRLPRPLARGIALSSTLLSALLLVPAAAHAQWGLAASLQSDLRFRGVSLSDERPSARVTVSYDHPSGWYGGASAAGVEVAPGQRGAQVLAYGGLAARLGSGLAWDLGASAVHFTASSRYDYLEVHAGLAGARWSARVSLSPDYYGSSMRSAYVEVDAAQPVAARLRLFGHAGVLVRGRDDGATGVRGARADVRAGIAAAFDAWDVQLAWVGAQRDRPNGYAAAYDRSTFVLGVTVAF
jgi:uncharacterized protein (TIGR02001 family)